MKNHHKELTMHYPQHHHQHQHHNYLHQHHHPQTKHDSLSDEVDSQGATNPQLPQNNNNNNQSKAIVLVSTNDGATIEVPKRPRGRPPGSKNKPKPPTIITRDAEPAAAMKPHILEIPAGHDIVSSLSRFSRRRNLGICVLAATGAVANVSLRQPSPPSSAAPASTISFHGRFDILSMSATFLPPAMGAISPAVMSGLSISLAGPQGQILGGSVVGPLLAAGTVIVVAAAFTNPTFHRLPVEDDVSVSVSVSGGDIGVQQQQQSNEHQRRPAVVGEGAQEMGIYSSCLPSDGIWAPTQRPY